MEIRYSHVEKLALATVHAVQRLRHYILLRQTLDVAHVNPFQFILTTRRMIGGKYNKWIAMLQEFNLEFVSAKSKKSLIFVELISDFPSEEEEFCEDMFVDEHIFPISTLDPWYGDIIIYLQMLKVPTHLSRDYVTNLRTTL